MGVCSFGANASFYIIFQNIMENRGFAPREQMLHFPYFQNYINLYSNVSCFFFSISKSHDLKIA